MYILNVGHAHFTIPALVQFLNHFLVHKNSTCTFGTSVSGFVASCCVMLRRPTSVSSSVVSLWLLQLSLKSRASKVHLPALFVFIYELGTESLHLVDLIGNKS